MLDETITSVADERRSALEKLIDEELATLRDVVLRHALLNVDTHSVDAAVSTAWDAAMRGEI